MAQFKSRAFIVTSQSYRETSRLLHIFCPSEGRLSLVARGLQSSKSKKATAAEPFNLVQVGYTLKEGASLGALTTIEVERVFNAGRENIQAYAVAAFWFDVLQHATQPRLSASDLFQLTDDLLRDLDSYGNVDIRTAWHFARLLRALGFGVEVDNCTECGGRDALLHFDLEQGSAVCTRCAKSRQSYFPLNANSMDFFVRAFGSRKPASKRTDVAGLVVFFQLVHELLIRGLEVNLKSYAFLSEVLQ